MSIMCSMVVVMFKILVACKAAARWDTQEFDRIDRRPTNRRHTTPITCTAIQVCTVCFKGSATANVVGMSSWQELLLHSTYQKGDCIGRKYAHGQPTTNGRSPRPWSHQTWGDGLHNWPRQASPPRFRGEVPPFQSCPCAATKRSSGRDCRPVTSMGDRFRDFVPVRRVVSIYDRQIRRQTTTQSRPVRTRENMPPASKREVKIRPWLSMGNPKLWYCIDQ